MLDNLIQSSALPNLHPAIVHFPIACLPLALAFDLVGLVLRGQAWLRNAATALYVVAASSAWLAVWAGESAADGLVGVPATVQPRIGEHSDWGHYTFYALVVLALLRCVVQFRPKLKEHTGARLGAVIFGLVVFGVMFRAADLGGALVYRHGLGVQVDAPDAEPDPGPASGARSEDAAEGTEDDGPPREPLDRLVKKADGGLAWTPAAEDEGALGTVLTPTDGTASDAVRVVSETAGDGLTLAVRGPATLLLPGSFGDVQVDATIEALDFEGSVGVVHHHQENGDGGSFVVDTGGSASLVDVRQGARTSLDSSEVEIPATRFVLAVSSAGGHLKGLLDGKTVTHGHIEPGPDGGCGIVLDGSGTVRLHEVTVQPLDSH